MALKAWWKARLMSSGGVHLDPDTDTYTVRFMTTPERDLGRVIFTDMSPDVARKMARDLTKAADHADTLNGKMAARNARRADLFEAFAAPKGLPGSGAARAARTVSGINYGVQADQAEWIVTRRTEVSPAVAADAFAARVEEFAISPGDRVNIEAGDERGSWGVVRLVDQDGLYHVAQADGDDTRVYERDEITK
jgi:hypothetical protein